MKKGARIITVSDEVLLGTTADQNTVVIARGLAEIGIELHRTTIVSNNKEELKKAILSSLAEGNITVICGALGPEKHDITRDVVSEALGLPLEKDEEIASEIEDFLKKRGSGAKKTDCKQAYFPRGSYIIKNELGTAHGFQLKAQNGNYLFALPGKPTELAIAVEKLNREFYNQTSNIILAKEINMMGVTEAKIVHALAELSFDSSCRVEYTGDRGKVGVLVTIEASDKHEAIKLFNTAYDTVKHSRLGQYIYGIDETREQALVRIMREKKLTVSTAESCTGGLIAKCITDCSGASEVFPGGVVSYSNDVKNELLSVKLDTLENHGAVSHQVARQMADGVRRRFRTDFGISATGIAGPTGGTDEKPVGLVYFALSQVGKETEIFKMNFSGNRDMIRRQSADFIIKQLLTAAISRQPKPDGNLS